LPCATLSDPNWKIITGGAFDATGNFYVIGKTSTAGQLVGVVAGGCNANTITTLSMSMTLQNAVDVQVTRAGNIAILDNSFSAVLTFLPPVNNALGQPVTTTPLSGNGILFALSDFDAALWTADTNNPPRGAYKYAFPAGGSPISEISGVSAGLIAPVGIVVTPLAGP